MFRTPTLKLLILVLFAAVAPTLSPSVANADRSKHKPVENEERKAELNGKEIRTIRITIREIFDDPKAGSFYQTANQLKITTKESVVRRELLFKENATYDEFKVEESIRNLRALGYFANIEVLPTVDGNFVDLEVRVQDTWTFIPEFAYSSGTGSSNVAAGVAEADLLGYGKRAEILYSENNNRKGVETVYADNHIWDTDARFVGGVFIRNDGNREVFEVGKPFRTLEQKEGWVFSGDILDTVGVLWEDGTESYIYRQKKSDIESRYTVAVGNPEVRVRRFSAGYDYNEARFYQATLQDYQDLNLNPATVSNDPADLPQNRRFSGPVLAYQMIEADFMSLNYIDRFERIQDYNLGDTFSFSTQAAEQLFGSDGNYLLFNSNVSRGWRFSSRSFMRAEIGGNSRYTQGLLENTLGRGEIKFYQSFHPSYFRGVFLGRHTLAVNLFADYGDRLDKDRQFLAGGDNVVRGYKANTFSGDKRLGFNLEDRVHFVDDFYKLVSLGGAVFLDAGGATTDPFGQLLTDQLYGDVGFGLRFAFPRSSGGRVLRVDLAFPLRDGPDGSSAWQLRVVLQGGQLFSSQLRSEAAGAERSNIEIGTQK